MKLNERQMRSLIRKVIAEVVNPKRRIKEQRYKSLPDEDNLPADEFVQDDLISDPWGEAEDNIDMGGVYHDPDDDYYRKTVDSSITDIEPGSVPLPKSKFGNPGEDKWQSMRRR